jgi:hypothetical protein
MYVGCDLANAGSTVLNHAAAVEVAPWVERLARVGYGAKALLYITVGLLAAQAAFGRAGRTTDTHGALEIVHGVTFGRVVLLVVAAGLIGYAVWRLVEAVVDPERRGTSAKAVAVRAGFVIRGLFHGALGVAALRLALGDGSNGSEFDAKGWTARAFELPGGDLMISIAALGVAGYGLYQFYRAYAPKLGRQLDVSSMTARLGSWVVGVSRFGLAARGVVFCLIGWFLFRAGAQHDAGEAGGLRESLRAVASLGRWPFVVVALGLVAYGAYQLLNARYRKIRVT